MVGSYQGAVAAVRAARPLPGVTTTVIAVDGFGGAGKSTLTARLTALVPSTVVHTDDFASWDNPLDWWPRLIEQVLSPLSRNEQARYQRYDWDSRVLAEWHAIEPGGVVLLEGVSSSREKFRPFLSLSIWVDTPSEMRLQRGIARDGETMRGAWDSWMADEDEWAAREHPRSKADYLIFGTT
jgi:uridine kinase